MNCMGSMRGGWEAPSHVQHISDAKVLQLYTGIPSVWTEDTVMFVLDSVIPRSV